MKKYVTFIISFGIIYFLIELASGLWLTMIHQPDFTFARQPKSEVQISYMPFIAAALAASIAYFITQIISRRKETRYESSKSQRT
ncbi:hypothetical protein [Halobacillus sp. A5]|uniref:hypothetical protein n=1 Tax=Halobacillus sp. A5 TaxID=2880263 RepID=UPI0020A699F4|nr:hypothetical protein [Halobacillus sp. A5]MCP3027319.1 hypothetical protein [Halobacillus sp. A5]